MTAAIDPSTSAPALVSADWLEERLGDPSLVIIEVDENPEVYGAAHIPGAHGINWSRDFVDAIERDFVDHEALGALLGDLGVTADTTIVLYGDDSNWWATYAFWLFSLFSVPNVRVLDGGRDLWVTQGRPTATDVPARTGTAPFALTVRDDATYRIFRDEVASFVDAARGPLVDVRSPAEYAGEVTHMAGYPQESALRAGHIPGAVSIPWKTAINEDGTYRDIEELRDIYAAAGATGTEPIITYCRIGERSSHSWFALTQILGVKNVRNYDGSWTEWGSLVGAKIER